MRESRKAKQVVLLQGFTAKKCGFYTLNQQIIEQSLNFFPQDWINPKLAPTDTAVIVRRAVVF
jgi:hypothetical protein